MSSGMELDQDLGQESLYQPLKRNHACLQCKKRKVKCDGARPHCAPCLRSHAHACRASNRAGAKLPTLLCEWAEAESPNGMGGDDDPLAAAVAGNGGGSINGYEGDSRRTSASGPSGISPTDSAGSGSGPGLSGIAQRQKGVSPLHAQPSAPRKTSSNSTHHVYAHTHAQGPGLGAGNAHLNAKKAEREKEKRRDEEKETLLARIADLEARLSQMSTPSASGPGSGSGESGRSASIDEVMEDISSASGGFRTGDSGAPMAFDDVPVMPDLTADSGVKPATGNTAGMGSYNFSAYIQPQANPGSGGGAAGLLGNGDQTFDFSSFFLVPTNWPRNLPSPYLLEHLIDTFFQHVPQSPRMIHRASLLARLMRSPTHEDFPHPALLHAICASAAAYTAWVHALPPEQLESKVQEMLHIGADLETIGDFALAQAEGARRAIHQSSNVCYWGAGRRLMDVLQAQVLMSEVYSQKGFTMLAWTLAAIPVRLIQGLELTNRNIPKRYKLGLLPVTQDPVEKEERLATVWQTYITDAFFAVGSYWQPSMDEREWYCKLPGPHLGFKKGVVESNPQGPNDQDVYRSHPVADPFVLMCKTAILAMRSARWRWQWAQRELRDGDELTGMQHPEFQQLVRDIYEFQATMPLAIKNIFKLLDNGAHAFDANLLCIHIIPQVTLLMLYEQFADWDTPNSVAIMQMQRAYESIVGIVHLIPSNLDVSIIMNSMMCFAFYVAGRIIADFTFHALERGAFSLAVRHRADLMAIQGLLARYGAKSPMGIFMGNFLESYLSTLTQGQKPDIPCRNSITANRDGNIDVEDGSKARFGEACSDDARKAQAIANAQANSRTMHKRGDANDSANMKRRYDPEDEPPIVMPAYASASNSSKKFSDQYLSSQTLFGGKSTSYPSAPITSGTSGNTPDSIASSGQQQGRSVGPGQEQKDWSFGFANFTTSVRPDAPGGSGIGGDGSINMNPFAQNIDRSARSSTGDQTSPTTSTGTGGTGNNGSFDMRTPSDVDYNLAGAAFSMGGSFAPGAAGGGVGHAPGLGWGDFGLGSSSGSTGASPNQNMNGVMSGMMGNADPAGMFQSTGMTPYLNFDTPGGPGLETEGNAGGTSMGMSAEQVDFSITFDKGSNSLPSGDRQGQMFADDEADRTSGIQLINSKTFANMGALAGKRVQALSATSPRPGSSGNTHNGPNGIADSDEPQARMTAFDNPPPMAGMQFAGAKNGSAAGGEAALRQMMGMSMANGGLGPGAGTSAGSGPKHVGVNGDLTGLPEGANGANDSSWLQSVMGAAAAELSLEDMMARFDAENRQHAQQQQQQQHRTTNYMGTWNSS